MNRKEYLAYHRQCCDKMIEITKKKNSDYAGFSDDDDPFANFRLVEKQGTCSTEVGFLTRMSDKTARIQTFVKRGVLNVPDESIQDTLLDLANYCVLLAGYIKSKKEACHGKYIIESLPEPPNNNENL